LIAYNPNCTWEVSARDAQGNIITSQIVTQSGLLTFEFTATGTKSRIYVRRTASSVTFGSFGVGTLSVHGKFAKSHGVGLAYRYGFNSQEKDDEIYGTGNSYTAEYWQYDARLGRRWNVDPVVKPWESPYACFSNNPILISDIKGDNGEKPHEKSKNKAERKFDKKITQPLKLYEQKLVDAELDFDDIMTKVQFKANELAEKYQRKKWLQQPTGGNRHSTHRNKYNSRTMRHETTQRVSIIAYHIPVINHHIDNKRPPNSDMVTTVNTGIVAEEGGTIQISFNPLAIENSLKVYTTNVDGTQAEISETGLISDKENNRFGVFIFNQTITITVANAGEISYEVRNTRPDDREDNWEVIMKVTGTPVLRPTPLIQSNSPYYPNN